MVYFKQFLFGVNVFLHGLTLKNIIHISGFVFKRYILNKKIPFSAVLAITYRCQCRCVHCSIGDYDIAYEMSLDEIKRLIDEIAKAGIIKITFFGGEPLIRKDIIADLVRYANLQGIRTSIDTNGIFLDEDLIKNLKSAGIGNINVSIDSADPIIHNKLRGYDGCFERAISAIKLCVKYKIPCLVSTYASKRAIESNDLERIIKLAKSLNANGVKILFPILSGRWRKKEEELLNDLEYKKLVSLMDPSYVYIEDALEMIKSRGKGCSAIKHNLIYISPSGDIQPCPSIPLSFGNIKKSTFSDIMKRMYSHPIFKKHKCMNGCLMNDMDFRKRLFSEDNDKYPVEIYK